MRESVSDAVDPLRRARGVGPRRRPEGAARRGKRSRDRLPTLRFPGGHGGNGGGLRSAPRVASHRARICARLERDGLRGLAGWRSRRRDESVSIRHPPAPGRRVRLRRGSGRALRVPSGSRHDRDRAGPGDRGARATPPCRRPGGRREDGARKAGGSGRALRRSSVRGRPRALRRPDRDSRARARSRFSGSDPRRERAECRPPLPRPGPRSRTVRPFAGGPGRLRPPPVVHAVVPRRGAPGGRLEGRDGRGGGRRARARRRRVPPAGRGVVGIEP